MFLCTLITTVIIAVTITDCGSVLLGGGDKSVSNPVNFLKRNPRIVSTSTRVFERGASLESQAVLGIRV